MARLAAKEPYDANGYPKEKETVSINNYKTNTGTVSPLTVYQRATMPSTLQGATIAKKPLSLSINTENRNTSGNIQSSNPTAKTSISSSGVGDKVNALRDANSVVRSQLSTNSNSSSNGGSGVGSSASSALAEQQARQAAAQNYYNNNLSALQNAYNQRLSGLQSNFASTQDLLKSNFNLSKDNLYSDAERALQEAYINRMMNERALQQQLNAQGLNGGATESAIASLLNNYGTSRNNINTVYNSNLAQLEQAYLNNLAQAQQEYNDAVAQAAADNASYRMELENALYRAMLG